MKEPYLSDGALLDDVEAMAGSPGLHLWWLGQSGYLFKWGPRLVLVDPYLSDSLTKKYSQTDKPHVRMSLRVIDPTAFRDITFVTASHAHTDHLDAETLGALREQNDPTFVAPRAIAGLAAERWGPDVNPIVLMNAGESQTFGDFSIRAVASAHEELDTDAQGDHRYLGYVFGFGGLNVYHSGDTVLYEGLIEKLRRYEIDIALLPINGRSPERRVAGNLSGREAARLAREIGAKLVIPCHYDMFEFNTATPDEFVAECERLKQPYRVLQLGERFSGSEIAK